MNLSNSINKKQNFIESIKKIVINSKKVEKIQEILLEEQNDLQNQYEKKINEIMDINTSLELKIQKMQEKIEDLEVKERESIHIKSKIEQFWPLLKKFNNYSETTKKLISNIFVLLVEERLQVIIKLTAPCKEQNSCNLSENESVYEAFENLIHSDILLNRAIEIASKNENFIK